MTMNLAQEAYEAYANHTGWKSLATGSPLPQWCDLPKKIQEAWQVSAAWVAGKLTGNHDWRIKKPLAVLESENTMLRDALVRIVGVDTKEELLGLEQGIRGDDAPVEERVAVIIAIQALIATLPA